MGVYQRWDNNFYQIFEMYRFPEKVGFICGNHVDQADKLFIPALGTEDEIRVIIEGSEAACLQALV